MLSKFKFTDKEKKEIINSIVYLVDTREQVNDHILSVFDKHKMKYEKKKLNYGDYSFYIPKNEALNIPRDIYFDKEVVIERKGSLTELSGNLTNGRDRLEKEFALAPKDKVLLVENGSYEDIIAQNYGTKMNRKAFLASIHVFWFRYNCPFIFMEDKDDSAVFIKYYFEAYLKEYLR